MRRPDAPGRARCRAPLALLAALALGTGGCDFYHYRLPSPDDLWPLIPWLDHMRASRAVHPYETDRVPRRTVAGTVPVSGGEPDWLGEWSTGKTTTADTLKNPLAAGAGRGRAPGPEVPILPREAAAAGDTLYQYYCTVCHGPTGAADGPVSRQMAAPSLLTARARAYSDGYLYSIIRYGRGVMPRYGDKVYSPLKRWAIVSHVRALQRAAPVAGDPKATAPIPPSASVTGSTGGYPQ